MSDDTASPRRTVRAVVSGRVQGVGYRASTAAEARARGLAGHVRNRPDGTVEALLAGPEGAVAAMLDALRRGPPAARVDAVAVEALADGTAGTGFAVLPTA